MNSLENSLFTSKQDINVQAREKVFRAASSALLPSYWPIGKLIVEDEIQGKNCAEYLIYK